MAQQIFVNLPVKDLDKTVAFFTHLGYTFNADFTNENATCMIISDTIFVMLLVEPFFKTFTDKEIADTQTTVEAILCLSMDSKQAINEHVQKAVEAGANVYRDPQDHGFMYQSSFQDIDGHLWEFVWVDTTQNVPS